MATLNDVISCYNELVDEVNGHTASIDALTAKLASINTDDIIKRIDAKTDLQTFTTAMATLTAKLETRLAQVEARLDELVQEHDVMMDTISSLLAAPTTVAVQEEKGTVELKRVGKKPTAVEEEPAPTVEEEPTVELKRVEKTPTAVEEEPTVELKRVEKTPTVSDEEEPAPTPTANKPTVAFQGESTPTVELKRVEKTTPTPAPTANKRAPAPKTTEIQKRAFARQYMVEHGAKVEDLRNPERINETIASDEFAAWMNAR